MLACLIRSRPEAVRREAAIRPLASEVRLGKAAIEAAARQLGLRAAQVYWLIRTFRAHPVTASLLPHRPGPDEGKKLLAPAMEAKIEAAIEQVYLRPERTTIKQVCSARCDGSAMPAGLTAPSLKAVRARVSARACASG